MNRKETTKFLSDLLISNRLLGRGKYYAREVSIDYRTSNAKRIDFMQFEPGGAIYQSAIKKRHIVHRISSLCDQGREVHKETEWR